jgi:hypothetical protein
MAKPFRPEPKFFLDDGCLALGLDHYESAFFTDPTATALGEKSTSYLDFPQAAERIHAMLPAAFVLVVLRDPVRRAVSNYRFTSQHGLEELSIGEALRRSASDDRAWDRDRTSVSPHAYLPRGRYIDDLVPFAAELGSEQLQVVFYEELIRGSAVVHQIYDLLRVDSTFVPPSLGSVVNGSGCDERLDRRLESEFRDFFREPNRDLEQFLGRALPWT